MKQILAIIDNISEWSGKVISILIPVIMLVLLYEVALRFLFNAPTYWAHEFTLHLFALVSVLAGAYVHRQQQHVKIDIIYLLFPPRIRAVMDTVTYIFFFMFMFVLIYYGSVIAIRSVELRQTVSPSPWGSPLWPIKCAVPLAGILLLLQGIADFIRTVTYAVTGKEMS